LTGARAVPKLLKLQAMELSLRRGLQFFEWGVAGLSTVVLIVVSRRVLRDWRNRRAIPAQ
jgi:hypothetical protein